MSVNDVTGDPIRSGVKGEPSKYKEEFPRIFGEKPKREYTWDDFPPVGEAQEQAKAIGIEREKWLDMVRSAKNKGLHSF